MMGAVGWKWSDIAMLTLREVVIQYDAHLVTRWDHTAQLSAMLYNLTATVHNLVGKSKVKTKATLDFHPYRKKGRKAGLKITPDNMSVLKQLGHAISKR